MGKQPFINPYNFVPFGSAVNKKRRTREEQYRGRAPLISGWLTVELYTRTPLIIPDGAHPRYWDCGRETYVRNPADNQKKKLHKEYRFLRIPGEDGEQLVIPGSELRGMIRSVYETATDSCVPFLLNDKPISQRVPTYGSLRRRGLLAYERISPDSGQRHWVLYNTEAEKVAVSVDNYGNMRYKNGGTVKEKNGSYVEGHGWLQYNIPVDKRKPYHIAYLEAKKIIYSWDFTDSNGKPDFERNKEPYKMLKSALDRDGASGKNPNERPNRNLASALERAKNGGDNKVPVYYFIVRRGEEELVYLSNSAIGRIAQRRKWKEIMGDHAPCDTDELCPACQLFGTVKGRGLKGHVRVTDANPTGELQWETHTLQILGEPRTTAFELYLRKPGGAGATYWNFDFYGEKVTDSRGNERTEYHDLAQAAPRGRKMYWHCPIAADASRGNMNSTMEAVSSPDPFVFRVYFDEVTEAQLQNLIWVITLGENRKESSLQHKLEHAKPLGYGSVKMVVTEKTVRRVSFHDGSIEVRLDREAVADTVGLGPDMDPEAVPNLRILCDTKSVPEGIPVRYPTESGRNGDLIYQWFAANRKNSKYLRTLPEPGDRRKTLLGSWNEAGPERTKAKQPQNTGQEGRTNRGQSSQRRIYGTVKFFQTDRNFGYIAGEDGIDYRININPNYNPGLVPEDLRKGKRVAFSPRRLGEKWVANQCVVI